MAIRISRSACALALAASLSMAATPALAQGWGGGWGGGRHHDDGISAGDVFAGVLVLGTIAAIASASSKSNRDSQARSSDTRDQTYREEAPRYSDRQASRDQDSRSYAYNARGIDGAVDSCVSEVERSSRSVDSVDTVNRDGDGWRVEGRVRGGTAFACSVANGGRIRSVTVDGHAAYAGDTAEEGPQTGGG